jgi:hypothetical protein
MRNVRAKIIFWQTLAAALCACGAPQRSPFFGDEKYLVLGVDPGAEAQALIADLEAQGYEAQPRLRGEHFSALGVIHPDSSNIGVRVVTMRGIALSLDRQPPTVFQPEIRYRLLPPPFPATHDADGDGFEELFVNVVRSSPEGEGACIAVYRVRDVGFVDPVDGAKFSMPPAPKGREPLWRSPVFCPLDASQDDPGSPADGSAVMKAPQGHDQAVIKP